MTKIDFAYPITNEKTYDLKSIPTFRHCSLQVASTASDAASVAPMSMSMPAINLAYPITHEKTYDMPMT